MSKRSLASDNHSGVHPQILASLTEINKDHTHSYEGDPLSLELKALIKKTFGEQFESFLVFNGTAANTLALNHYLKPWQAVICSDQAHLTMDECGAPEKIIGCKVITLPTVNGKINALDIKKYFIRRGDQHYSQVQAVTVTQPTELGTVYSLEELKAISDVCKELKLYLHIDGARLSNAARSLNTDFKTLCQYADAVSFGGTKNGLLFGELVLLNKNTSNKIFEFKFERKQNMQLPSKSRFISGQFLRYFKQDLWQEIAGHSLNLAQKLEQDLKELGVKVAYPVESNAVFCFLPKSWIKSLREKVFFYIWDEVETNDHCFLVRLMTSFDSTHHDIETLCSAIKELKSAN